MNKKVVVLGGILGVLLAIGLGGGWFKYAYRPQHPIIQRDSNGPFEAKPLSGEARVKDLPPAQSVNGTEAIVTIEGKPQTLKANTLGTFPQITVPANATLPVQVKLVPNIQVNRSVLDGGQFTDANAALLKTDENGLLRLEYQVRTIPGNYRVALDYQGQRLIFNFWVGPPLTPRVGH